jgi:hypothetical protein
MHCGCVGELANVYGSFVMPCKRSRAFVILVSAVVDDTSASVSGFTFLYQKFRLCEAPALLRCEN